MPDLQTKDERLEALRKRKSQLEARIKDLERKESAVKRKADTRLKVLIGAAVLADAAIHDATTEHLKTILERAITKPGDKAFLQGVGWMA